MLLLKNDDYQAHENHLLFYSEGQNGIETLLFLS